METWLPNEVLLLEEHPEAHKIVVHAEWTESASHSKDVALTHVQGRHLLHL